MESWERAKVWNEYERSTEEKLMKKKNEKKDSCWGRRGRAMGNNTAMKGTQDERRREIERAKKAGGMKRLEKTVGS